MLDLIEAMGVKLDQQIVDSLYTGIVTDTGCFRYPSTTVQTHIAAQKLLLAGAQMRLIHRLMLESTSRGKVQLICDALHSLRYELDGKCAVISLMRGPESMSFRLRMMSWKDFLRSQGLSKVCRLE